MIARLYVLLPFSVQVPADEKFTVYEYVENDCRIRVYPPVKSDVPASAGSVERLEINGRPAESYNALRIDFQRDEFNRVSGQECDPSYDFMSKAVNSFLNRLRYVTRAAQVRPINFPHIPWRLQYLKDDETELEKKEGWLRGRGALGFSLEYIGLTKQVWDDIYDLEPDFEAPTWNELLLDAHDTLPQIGPTIVLAATALEVFIGSILDEVAKRTSVPEELWKWINGRDWLRTPSTDEQFDVLLKVLLGYSLKEDSRLWQAFMNLRSARNSFVHEGVARIGNSPVTAADAGRLLACAMEIVQTIRGKLPVELQWKEYKHELKIEATWRILKETSEDTT